MRKDYPGQMQKTMLMLGPTMVRDEPELKNEFSRHKNDFETKAHTQTAGSFLWHFRAEDASAGPLYRPVDTVLSFEDEP